MVRPVSVKPMDDYKLRILFSTGEEKIFDVKPYFDMPFYSGLKDVSQFRRVFVNGDTVEWANGRDIAPHELYDDSFPA